MRYRVVEYSNNRFKIQIKLPFFWWSDHQRMVSMDYFATVYFDSFDEAKEKVKELRKKKEKIYITGMVEV